MYLIGNANIMKLTSYVMTESQAKAMTHIAIWQMKPRNSVVWCALYDLREMQVHLA